MFILAFLSTRANKGGVWVGIAACVLVTAWGTFTSGKEPIWNLGAHSFKLPGIMIGVIGHVVLLVVGYVASFCFPASTPEHREMTLWGWLVKRKSLTRQAAFEPATPNA